MFQFKQFSVRNDGTAFKVGTDAVLLGAGATVTGRERRFLDAGTGTGIIGLMIAQRLSSIGNDAFLADAIDADAASATIAAENFAASPWAASMRAKHLTLNELDNVLANEDRYDLIVSNPPYFENSLRNPDLRRSAARHSCEDGLSWASLLDFAGRHMAPGGRLAMILPADIAAKASAASAPEGIGLFRILRIKTSPKKPVTRVVLEFGSGATGLTEEALTIQESGAYTKDYLCLTKDFHIFIP